MNKSGNPCIYDLVTESHAMLRTLTDKTATEDRAELTRNSEDISDLLDRNRELAQSLRDLRYLCENVLTDYGHVCTEQGCACSMNQLRRAAHDWQEVPF